LKLVLEDEIVQEALPAIGYVHRGLEKLTEIRDFNQWSRSWNGSAASLENPRPVLLPGLEEMLGITAPPRARYLRTIGPSAPHAFASALARPVRRRHGV
jgi:ech hydrogenase subunit E